MGASDILKIAGDLAATLFILSLVFMLAGIFTSVHYRYAASTMSQVSESVNKYGIYENRMLTGDTVQSLVEQYSDELFLRVETKGTPSGFFGSALKSCKNTDSAYFVNPADKFYCTILRSADKAIIGMNFEQENVTLSNGEMQTAIAECNQRLSEE